MDRRLFTKAMGAVVAGMAAGSSAFAFDEKKADEKKADHICKGKAAGGKNECASAAYKHECAGKNNCKGQGGCKSGDNGCAGKNSCKGKDAAGKDKGGCAVPVKADHLPKDKAGKSGCSGKSGCKGR
jgi:hypothetical protein